MTSQPDHQPAWMSAVIQLKIWEYANVYNVVRRLLTTRPTAITVTRLTHFTSPSHGENRGSSPLGSANNQQLKRGKGHRCPATRLYDIEAQCDVCRARRDGKLVFAFECSASSASQGHQDARTDVL
jgi:hypothetical protein